MYSSTYLKNRIHFTDLDCMSIDSCQTKLGGHELFTSNVTSLVKRVIVYISHPAFQPKSSSCITKTILTEPGDHTKMAAP